MRREAAEKDVVPQVEDAGEIGRRPGEAVVHDRQIVLVGGAPDRVELGMVGRNVLGDERHHRDGPARFAPFADFLDRSVDIARRGDDHALQPVGMVAAEIGHVPVEGADDVDLDRRVLVADKAGPRGRDQEMRVGALVVHVLEPAFGLVVLGPGARLLRAHPLGVAAAMGLARRRLAEDALVGNLAVAVDMAAGCSAGFAGPDRLAVLRQFGKARPEAGIDVGVEDFRGRLDMRVGVEYAQPVFHHAPPSFVGDLYTPAGGSRKRRSKNARPGPSDCVRLPARAPSEDDKNHAASDVYQPRRKGDDARHRCRHQRHAGRRLPRGRRHRRRMRRLVHVRDLPCLRARRQLALCPPMEADEDAMLEGTASPRRPNSRLSCQLVVSAQMDGLVVHLPETQT